MLIAGVDEVGRGPLAGPVIAAAVILQMPIQGVADSKKLTPLKRKRLETIIQTEALCFAYGRAEVDEIDHLNIHHATLLAMKRAIENLSIIPDLIRIDGLHAPKVNIPCETIVSGDALHAEISAASILAKVYRDEEMVQMEETYPGYGFAQHKGYGTALHLKQLQALGPCRIHRQSYAPVMQSNLVSPI